MVTFLKRDLINSTIFGHLFLFAFFIFSLYIGISPYFMLILTIFGVFVSLFIYDGYYKVQLFFRSMPVQLHSIILSRYVTCLLFLTFLIFIQFVFMKIMALTTYDILYYVYSWHDVVIVCAIGMIIISIIIPLFYIFNSIYLASAIAVILFFIGTFKSITELVQVLKIGDYINFMELDKGYKLLVEKYIPWQPYLILLFSSVCLLIGSYFLSLFLLKRKDLL